MGSPAASRTVQFREDDPERASDVLRAGIAALRERLPSSWSLDPQANGTVDAALPFDAELRLAAPDGTDISVLVVPYRHLLNGIPIGTEPA